ncbi:CbrC family protein [Pectobacterium brasiliense]|uniref:CbrC family protein n=1 Tax=Enterobacterales TaxID=91347 RepID=UPI0015DF6D44|nr:CbrC family protein [Pectobacterium brasiliense]MBN3073923.1 CbrC family protein [Pectobacterium brasiliense]MBN3170475.1 CbrC family protein [Pectobacterium brasiliense]
MDPEFFDDNVSKEICYRTPDFFTWQDQEWATHCNDACEFHGDASAQDISVAGESTIHIWMERYDQNRKDWERFITGYVPGVDQGVINSSVNIVTLSLLTRISHRPYQRNS